MNFRDLVSISTGNLWRMKLRTFLTCSGVIIAIAAFVSMLSFGAGMQENVASEWNKLGLFNTIIVSEKRAGQNNDEEFGPRNHDEDKQEDKKVVTDSTVDTTATADTNNISVTTDTTVIKPLDDEALNLLSQIPGVRLAYPYQSFHIEVQIDDSTYKTEAQALPKIAYDTKLYSQMQAGKSLDSDSSKEVVLTEGFLEQIGRKDAADSLIGKQIIISARAASIDSGLVHIVKSDTFNIVNHLKTLDYDSLFNREYLNRTLKSEANSAINRFINGYLNANIIITDTLTIAGVLKSEGGHRIRTKNVLIPLSTAQSFTSEGAGKDPLNFLSMIQSGDFNLFETEQPTKTYSQITLDIDQGVLHKTVADSVRALGYRAFSYAEEFEEIEKFFFYFDMGLGLIGFIALITASLGIINTMVFSIIERKKEIGVLKSLGADERYIKMLFLSESGMIGTIGAVFGIIFGWLISRLASFIAITFMERQGVEGIELFSLPIWLILIAYAIGLVVSLAAGYFPASRAAKVDPVEALRNE